MGLAGKAKDKITNGGGIFTFLRSSISSQIASWIDMGTSFIFFAFVFSGLDYLIRSNLSVAVGAVCGGIVNCCINYRFTFHAKGQSVKAVAVKYALVWIGSLLLNMYGTTFFGKLLSHWTFLTDMGFRPDGIFAASRLTVSLAVSLAWNFVLQRNFVYRPSGFDRFAIAFIDFFNPVKKHPSRDNSENMESQSTFKTCRDGLQRGIYVIIDPLVRLMIRCGMTPNTVTTIGLLGNIAGAAFFVWAAFTLSQGDMRYDLVTWAGALIIGFSLFDMLDGQVARIGGMASTFGALYDSVLDRYCELLTLGAVAFYLFMCGYAWGALIAFLAMVGSVMVSYVRARAEGLGIECKVGFMQRPERVVVLSLGALATGVTGLSVDAESFDAMDILIGAVGIIALLANITAFARVAHCRRELTKK